MATNVIMPALGMDQETGTLVRWIKQAGESVTKGESIMEIETDKVLVEIEANASGILGNVTAKEGDEIPVGQVIAQIFDLSEAPTLGAPLPIPAAVTPSRTSTVPVAPIAEIPAFAPLPSGPTASPTVEPAAVANATAISPALIPASPLARRLAQEGSLDMSGLAGSGPEGAVLAADVFAAQVSPAPATAQVAEEPAESEPLAVGRAWEVMAERMTQSWTTVPQFVLMREVMASALIDLRTRILPGVEQRYGVRPTYTDLLVKLVAAALLRHPRLNASWREGQVYAHHRVNVGIAMATEEALVVPVIGDADRLSIGEIARRRQDLVERATSGKLTPSDVAGGTFTLTNLGMYGVDGFNAIVNPPQAAILAVGRIADRVVAVEGQPAVRPTLILTLSCDHRIVDGARAAQFLAELTTLVEEPWGLLV